MNPRDAALDIGAIERFLARLYTDAALLARFLANPRAVCADAGLDDGETEALARIDRDGLALAAESYARKRAGERGKSRGV